MSKLTEKDILRNIKREEGRIAKNTEDILTLRFEIDGCRKAVAFWKKELKKVQKNGKNK